MRRFKRDRVQGGESKEERGKELRYDDVKLLYMCGNAVPTRNSAFGTPTGDKKRSMTYRGREGDGLN